MYSILIVDDNRFIVDGLVSLLKGAPLGLEITWAYSPFQALRSIRKQKFHIALFDIMMGPVDGFELMDEIHLFSPQCKVIFLTAYDKFDYIQKAMRGSSFGYVLKNDGEEEILRTVEAAAAALDKEIETAETLINARQYASIAGRTLRREMLLEILESGRLPAEPGREFSALGIAIDPRRPLAAVLTGLDAGSLKSAHKEQGSLQAALEQSFTERLSALPGQSCVLSYAGSSRILSLYQPPKVNSAAAGSPLPADMYAELAAIFEPNGKTGSKDARCKVNTAIYGSYVDLTDTTVLDKLEERVFEAGEAAGEFGFLWWRDFENITPSKEKFEYPSHNMGLLWGYLQNGQADKAVREIEKIMQERRLETPHQHMAVYYGVVSVLLGFCGGVKMAVQPGLQPDIEELISIKAHRSWEALTCYLTGLVPSVLSCHGGASTRSDHRLVTEVNRYIEENITHRLSLADIACHVGYNSSYLSRLYKQMTGDGIFSYINAQRLLRAREMLMEGKYKVQEIASLLSFENTSNFIRFFRKNIGMTPLEFRMNGIGE